MSTHNGRQYTEFKGINLKASNGVLRFEDTDVAPTTTSGEYCLYVDSGGLKFDNGSSITSLSAASSTTPTWEGIYAADSVLALTSAAWTISQSANAGILILTKTGTGAGSPLVINNAGTADDIQIVNTDGGTTGAVISVDHQSASPADNDVIFTLEVNANDDGGGANEFGNIKFVATDVSAGTEDCKITMDTMVNGTSRNVLSLDSTSLTVGYGSAATFKSQGNYDVKLATGNGTTGYINITDGAAGEIAIVPDTTGVVTISTGLQTGGVTPTACIFNVAGSTGSGTTGYGLKVNATTMTSGTVLEVDSASSSSGLLFDFQLATVSVLKMTEAGLITAAGTAASNTLDITAGDVRMQDGSITVTDADDASTLSITNNSCVGGASLISIAGSGTYTGTTTKSFMNLTPSGLTTGTAFYLPLAAITTGKGLHITSGATITQGSLVYVQTTGAAVAATSANIAYFNETATAANANRTGSTVYISSDRTVAGGTTADDFDTLSVIKATTRSSGTAATAGSVIYAEVQSTGTVTETSNGVEVLMDSGGTGTGVLVTHSATSSINISAVNNSITSGKLINATSSSTGTTTGSLIYASSATTGAVATNGLVAFVASGNYTSTSNVGLLNVSAAATAAGTIVNVIGTALTTGTAMLITGGGSTALTTGSLLSIVGPSGAAAIETTGVVSFSVAGNYTSVTGGAILNVSGAATTAGTLMNITCTAITSGVGLAITSSGTGITSGSLLRCTSATTGAVATNGIVSLVASGNYTSTTTVGALLNVSAAATTGGTILNVLGTALTDGKALNVTGAGAYTGTGFVTITPSGLTTGAGVCVTTAALTTGQALSVVLGTTTTSGNGIKVYDNSADTTERGLLYVVSDNTAATGAVPLLIKQDSVNNTNYRKLIKESNSGITIWMGNGNGANGVLTGTAGDILINGASNKPEYCTGTNVWVALV